MPSTDDIDPKDMDLGGGDCDVTIHLTTGQGLKFAAAWNEGLKDLVWDYQGFLSHNKQDKVRYAMLTSDRKQVTDLTIKFATIVALQIAKKKA